MSLETIVICPYCGHRNTFKTEKAYGRELYTCDLESGGCDGDFVIEYRAHITTDTKRIEGEKKRAESGEGENYAPKDS